MTKDKETDGLEHLQWAKDFMKNYEEKQEKKNPRKRFFDRDMD